MASLSEVKRHSQSNLEELKSQADQTQGHLVPGKSSGCQAAYFQIL
jgi:hypothetical protein